MLPRVPWIGIHSYGVLVAAGFLIGLWLAGRLAKWRGVPAGALNDAVVWAALAGLLGAKLTLAIVQPDVLREHPWQLLMQGGVFYGGLVAAIPVGAFRVRQLGVPFHAAADACSPALAVAHALGRMGCFLAGCCWGRACDLPWAVRFSDPDAAAVRDGFGGVAVHPTQLYEVGGELVLAVIAWRLLRRRAADGVAWWTYVGGYGLLRLLVEHFRGDPRGSWISDRVSTSQGFAVVAIVLAAAMLTWRLRAGRHSGPGTAAALVDAGPAPPGGTDGS